MTNRPTEEKDGEARETDLRDRMGRDANTRDEDGADRGMASGYGDREFEPTQEKKLPPVWPGDEKQPWFRRERGLPPLPEEKKLGPGDFPTGLTSPQVRGRAWGIGYGLPLALSFTLLAPIALLAIAVLFANAVFFYRGQDIGCLIFKTRVLRENGDVAGFFHMWARSFASIVSLLAFGAGFWTSLSDPEVRTWHDKWLKTYVVQDSEEYRTRNRSSSEMSSNIFWITSLLFIAAPLLLLVLSAISDSPSSQ